MLCGSYLGEYFISSLNYLFYTKENIHNVCHSVGIQIMLFYFVETPSE